MSLTYNAAVEQTITAGEQIHQIVNGAATTEVTVEDGSKVPSIRKALLDNFYFKDPIAWQVGQTENVFNQLRQFIDGSWWYAPSATASNPISMGSTPVGDSLWKIHDFDAIKKLEPRINEALRRSYAEAGYNLVDGSFQAGFALVNANDVALDDATGKVFSGVAGTYPAGTSTSTSGFVDRSSAFRHSFIYVSDYLYFSANHTAALQSAIEAAKQYLSKFLILPNQTLNLTCDESGAYPFAAAVVFDGLHNCEIIGSGPLSELKAATGGSGAPAFAIGRIQNCTGLHFHDFRHDGDYANHTGDAGSRSVAFILTTFDRESPLVDLGEVRDISFRNIGCYDAAGFIWGVRRGGALTYANPMYNISVENCYGHDAAQANNTIGFSFVIGGSVKFNRFTNTAVQNPYPSLYIDVSRGCKNIDVEHNHGRMFVFGIKSEGHAAGGVYAISDHINVRDNILEEVGNPNSFVAGVGASAGSTYAYKIRSENSECARNTWTPRTELVTAGGLYSGIYIEQNNTLGGVVDVHGNSGYGSEYGIIQNKTNSDMLTSCKIHNNKIRAQLKGVLFQADCDVDDNEVYDTASLAIDMQISNNSRARRNKTYNCSSPGSAVFNQGGAGAAVGFFEFLDNEITDTRGASAATHGYNLASGLVYTTRYRINKGVYSGLLGEVYAGNYIGLFDFNDIKFSGQVNGATLLVTNGYNILNVTSVDSNTIQINFKRPVPSGALLVPTVSPLTGGVFTIPFGSSTSYYRVRYVNSSGAGIAPSTINISCI